MKKRILAIILCLCIAFSPLPETMLAAQTPDEWNIATAPKDLVATMGNKYDIEMEYSYIPIGVFILEVSPEMTLPAVGYIPPTSPNSQGASYLLPRFVGFDIDADRSLLESIVIPPTIKILESSAFDNCSNLQNVTLYPGYESSLSELRLGAFQKCASLTEIELPKSVRIIGPRCFFDCQSLTSVTLPEGLESIGYEAFALCPNLKSITIPASVTEIDIGAFGVANVNILPYHYDPAFIIRGYTGSYAEQWANWHGCRFVPIDGDAYDLFEGTGIVSIGNFDAMPHKTYTLGQFTDVDENKWYGAKSGAAVKTAFELGIISGKGDGIFDPEGNVQVTEALKMAAVVHNIYHGGSGKFVQPPGKWWKVYSDYCIENGIITARDFDGHYFRAISRAEMAYIFANALPFSELTVKNDVTELPDVDDNTPYSDQIFTLYRCGALRGNDDYGAFTPDADITRAASAAIIARIALPSQRLTFTLKSDHVQSDTYIDKMWVNSLGELEKLYKERLWGLYPDMRVHMSEALSMELRAQPHIYNDWVPMAANISTVYNENDDDLMVYTFSDYHTDFEMEALMKNASVASRASAAATGYVKQIDDILASIIKTGTTEREKLLAIHDWMIANIAYDLSYSDSSYYVYGPLDKGLAVCQGYSELFYYLANRAGIECYTVSGVASGGPGQTDWEAHMWNVVFLTGDENPYFIDVTFDDPVPDTKTGRSRYFMVSAQTLSADHQW